MSIEGFVDYKRREFCNNIKCPIQVQLNNLMVGSEDYEKIRKVCQSDCRFTTWQFHRWLIEKGYLIVRPKEKGGKI